MRCLKELEGYRILATDGEFGKVDDFYFDDSSWVVRYVVVKTGKWLRGRRVLLHPDLLGRADWESRNLPANLTIQEVTNRPGAETDAPVSEQREERLVAQNGWPAYGSAAGTLNDENIAMGIEMVARARMAEETDGAASQDRPPLQGDPHLRSVREVTGYGVESTDGPAGHVGDFVVDDRGWVLRYMVVDLRRLLSGKKVLMPIDWLGGLDGSESRVHVGHSRERIRGSPAFDPAAPVNWEPETRIYDYYGRPKAKRRKKRHSLPSS